MAEEYAAIICTGGNHYPGKRVFLDLQYCANDPFGKIGQVGGYAYSVILFHENHNFPKGKDIYCNRKERIIFD